MNNKTILLSLWLYSSLNNVQADSESDVYWMTRTIYGEARYTSSKIKKAVAATVRNRVYSRSFPSSIEDVVNQRSQFIGVNTEPQSRSDYLEWNKCKNLAKEVLNTDYKKDGFSERMLYFHDSSINPPFWTRNLKEYKRYYINKSKYMVFYIK